MTGPESELDKKKKTVKTFKKHQKLLTALRNCQSILEEFQTKQNQID